MTTVPEDLTDALLELITQALDEGRRPDRDALRAVYPGNEDLIDRLLRAAGEYDQLVENLCPPAWDDLGPGAVLGDFVLGDLVGTGGMGKVFRARQRSLGDRVVAVKVVPLPPSLDTTAQRRARRRFEREALVASSLHHPHLAEVYGFGASKQVLFYAMQMVEGPTLQDVLHRLVARKSGPPSAGERRRLVELVTDVASALALVHDRKLVHRDVKPGNVKIRAMASADSHGALIPDGPAILLDFGLVRSVDPEVLTRTEGSSATPAYAAPEQLLGKEVDARADVFALGATLHDLIASREPGLRQSERAATGLEPIKSLVPDIDPDLAAIVDTARDPEALWRYADGTALERDLRAWLDGERVSVRRLGVMERMTRYARRRPSRVLAGTWIGMVAVLTFTLSLGLMSTFAGARAAANHARDGNILALGVALEELEDGWGTSLLLNSSVQPIAHALWNGGQHPVVDIFEQLKAGMRRAALETAAITLSVPESDSHPVVLRFFLSNLRATEQRDRRVSLELVQRIVSERPATTLPRLRQLEPIASALRGLLGDETLTPRERLSVVAGLAGCGTARDVQPVQDWLMNDASTYEERRLGMVAIAHIFFRLRSLATDQDPATVRDALERAETILDAAFQWATEFHGSLRESFESELGMVAQAAVVHCRDRGLLPPNQTVFDRHRGLLLEGVWLRLQAHAGADVAKRELNRTHTDRGELSIFDWGGSCYWLGDPHTTQAARLVCAHLREGNRSEGVDAVAEFENGYAHQKQVDDMRMFADFDPASKLGAVLKSEMQPLDAARATRANAAVNVIAEWDLSRSPARVKGDEVETERRGIRYEGVEQGEPGPSDGWVLFAPGVARLVLRFEVSRETAYAPADVYIEHLAAGRAPFSYRGIAHVRFSFDGDTLEEDTSVEQPEAAVRIIPINESRLSPGGHEFSIDLLSNSTTTYRVRRIRITFTDS